MLAYAHALDEEQRLDRKLAGDHESTVQPTTEEIKALMLTHEAINATLERWRQEFEKHNVTSPRWEKAHQLFTQLEAELNASVYLRGMTLI